MQPQHSKVCIDAKKDDRNGRPFLFCNFLCVSMTDYRTFRGDYQKLVDFVHWYNEYS